MLFFENSNFWTTLFSKIMPNFWRSAWTSVKVNLNNHFHFTDFFAKSTPSWLTSKKLHHWGHTKPPKPTRVPNFVQKTTFFRSFCLKNIWNIWQHIYVWKNEIKSNEIKSQILIFKLFGCEFWLSSDIWNVIFFISFTLWHFFRKT